MAVNVAFTSPVNKPGQEPVLSANDVWKGIVETVRRPQDFVDYVSHLDIYDDTGLTLRRTLYFVPSGSHGVPGGKLDQSVKIFPEFKVEFVAAATGKATMSVSKDADGDATQVYLTQAFEVAYPPGVEAGSPEAIAQHDHLSKVAQTNVVSNIRSFRELKLKSKVA